MTNNPGILPVPGQRADRAFFTSLWRDLIYRPTREECIFPHMAEPPRFATATYITEVAYRWGFNDSAHFSRLFKASFGMSPTQYRSSRRLGASDR